MNIQIEFVSAGRQLRRLALVAGLMGLASALAPTRGLPLPPASRDTSTSADIASLPTVLSTPHASHLSGVVSVPGVAPAPTGTHGYSLADFIEIVMARSPGVQSAILLAKSADYKAKAVRSSYLPKINALGQTGYLQGAGISPFENLTNDHPQGHSGYFDTGGGTLTFPLYQDGTFLGINTPPKAEIYYAIRSQSEAQVLLTRDQIRYESINAYYLAFEDVRKGVLLGREVGLLNQLAKIAKVEYNHSLISEAEFEISKLRVDQAEQDYEQSQWETANAFVVVASLLGVNDATTVRLPAEQPVPKTLPLFPEVLTHVLESNPALLQQFAALQQAKAEHTLATTKFDPTATIDESYLYGNDYNPPGNTQWVSRVAVSVPLFDGGETYYEVRAATKKVEGEKSLLYQTKLDVEAALHNDYESLQTVRRLYLQNQVAAQQSRITVLQDDELAKLNEVSMPDYLTAQLTYINSAILAEETFYSMMSSYAELDKASSYTGSTPILGSRLHP